MNTGPANVYIRQHISFVLEILEIWSPIGKEAWSPISWGVEIKGKRKLAEEEKLHWLDILHIIDCQTCYEIKNPLYLKRTKVRISQATKNYFLLSYMTQNFFGMAKETWSLKTWSYTNILRSRKLRKTIGKNDIIGQIPNISLATNRLYFAGKAYGNKI